MYQTERKPSIGIVVLVTVLACIALGLLGFIVYMKLLPQPAVQTEPTTVPTTQPPTTLPTETTEATTVPTEPPIPLTDLRAEDFGYVDGVFTCVTRDCLMGIDVSKYQGAVDWHMVKAAGYDFVMIRLGYRGYGEAGGLKPDDWAKRHYQGAKEAGLLVGAYFFSQAVSVEEALEEAAYALELAKDWELELPLVYDWEYIEYGRAAEVDTDTLTACAIAFCDEILAGGRDPMVYVSPWFGNMHLDQLKDYPHWLARYTDQLDYPYRFAMWQYTCTGTVPGVQGEVDINIFFPELLEDLG